MKRFALEHLLSLGSKVVNAYSDGRRRHLHLPSLNQCRHPIGSEHLSMDKGFIKMLWFLCPPFSTRAALQEQTLCNWACFLWWVLQDSVSTGMLYKGMLPVFLQWEFPSRQSRWNPFTQAPDTIGAESEEAKKTSSTAPERASFIKHIRIQSWSRVVLNQTALILLMQMPTFPAWWLRLYLAIYIKQAWLASRNSFSSWTCSFYGLSNCRLEHLLVILIIFYRSHCNC